MKLDRHEVRLRPKYPAEAELIAALEAQSEIYGGKNELMRQCLLRGYLLFKQKMDAMSSTGDEVAALDALAQAVLSGDYGYRVIKTYLGARPGSAGGQVAARESRTLDVPAQARPEAIPAAPAAPVSHDAPVDPATAEAGSDEGRAAAERDESEPSPAPGQKSPNPWGRFRGIAGSGGGTKGEAQ